MVRRNVCLPDVRHLEIRFTSPSIVPQLNSISIVSKKEGAPRARYENFLSARSLPSPFCFRPPAPTNLEPSLKLVRIGVMHDGRLLREKSSRLTAGFKSTSLLRPSLRPCEGPDEMEKYF